MLGTALAVTDQAGNAEVEIQIAATCAAAGCVIDIEVTAGDVTETTQATVRSDL
jgi:hypothetical protein